MSALAVAIGCALGVGAALAHLWLTQRRAALFVAGRGRAALALLPLGLLAVAAAVLLAARFDRVAVLGVPVGLLAARLVVFRLHRRSP
ncbi:MAG: hypothetical protein IPM79_27860 [Polyangiaceae bacterium]|nr:hypothetical protein [Polyangiaceae bacterium]MBK8941320.1 hypothetical protein [Polyangiaceae bacterium]